MGVCWVLISSGRQQRASSGPSLSLPVLDSARSVREGSLPSFSRKWCRKILNQRAFLKQVEQGQERKLHVALGMLLQPVGSRYESFCTGHPVQIAHGHRYLSFLKYDLFVIVKLQELGPQWCQCDCGDQLCRPLLRCPPPGVLCALKGCTGMFGLTAPGPFLSPAVKSALLSTSHLKILNVNFLSKLIKPG